VVTEAQPPFPNVLGGCVTQVSENKQELELKGGPGDALNLAIAAAQRSLVMSDEDG
jgi:hypothetical protein